jgi:pilus assembly protein CpaB
LRRTSRLLLLFGIGLAVLTFVLIIFLFSGPGPNGNTQPSGVADRPIVVAVSDIPLGALVTQDMVTSATKPATAIDADTLGDSSQAVGQTARKAIVAGAQVHRSDFAVTGTVQLTVPTGKEAMAISVNELTGVGNLVQQGDYVDMLISLRGEAFPVVQVLSDGTITVVTGINTLSVKMPVLLQGVQVLATIDAAPPVPQAAGATAAPQQQQTLSGQNKLLILAITPAQAEVILFGRTTGTIDVVLRNPQDTTLTANTDGVILKSLVDKYGVLPPQLIQAILPKK